VTSGRPSTSATLKELFDRYFSEFPWATVGPHSIGVDVGCGSGRWARFVAPHVKALVCVDPSSVAIRVAKRAVAELPNCVAVEGAGGELPLRPASLDFGYSLGVLHHTPEPAAALRDTVRALKPGAPFLVYLYYAFDNRPRWFRALWRLSDGVRRPVSRAPFLLKRVVTTVIAATVYWPLARTAKLLSAMGRDVDVVPLSIYRDAPFYIMRNDALDRFATRVEWRFTASQIRSMMEAAGLVDIRFRPSAPYWCAVGTRRTDDR